LAKASALGLESAGLREALFADSQKLYVAYTELKIKPVVTQNKQSTTYLCHNWNLHVKLYNSIDCWVFVHVLK